VCVCVCVCVCVGCAGILLRTGRANAGRRRQRTGRDRGHAGRGTLTWKKAAQKRAAEPSSDEPSSVAAVNGFQRLLRAQCVCVCVCVCVCACFSARTAYRRIIRAQRLSICTRYVLASIGTGALAAEACTPGEQGSSSLGTCARGAARLHMRRACQGSRMGSCTHACPPTEVRSARHWAPPSRLKVFLGTSLAASSYRSLASML
jgi:hypothetical protein